MYMACIGVMYPRIIFFQIFLFRFGMLCSDPRATKNLGNIHHPKALRQGSDKGWLRIITKVMDESGGGVASRFFGGWDLRKKPKPLMLDTLQGTDTYITYPNLEQSS